MWIYTKQLEYPVNITNPDPRIHALDEIHFKEAQLTRLDYLRHSINTKKKI